MGLIAILFLLSCKSEKEKINDAISEYIKPELKNPNSLKILKYELYEILKSELLHKPIDSAARIEYSYSAINSDGKEIFKRGEGVITDKYNFRGFKQDVGVEFASAEGVSNYEMYSVPKGSFHGVMNNSEVVALLLDKSQTESWITQKTIIKAGYFSFEKMTPGDYLFKFINKNISLENVSMPTFGEFEVDNGVVLNMYNFVTYLKIYFLNRYDGGFETYITNRQLFNETYNDLTALKNTMSNTDRINRKVTTNIWNTIKSCLSSDFLKALDLTDDYNFVVGVKPFTIESGKKNNCSFNVVIYY